MNAAGEDVAVGFVGLGSTGSRIARNLLSKQKYRVTGCNIHSSSSLKFVSDGGHIAASLRDLAKSSRFLVYMASSEEQIDETLFDSECGVLQELPTHAIIIVCSNVSYDFHHSLPSRIASAGRPDVQIIDCPVPDETKRAAEEPCTIIAAGPKDALDRADLLLRTMAEKLYIVPGGGGAASKVNMINQLLVGIHIAAAAEAMAMAVKAGLNMHEVYDIIANAAGGSWAFSDRVSRMLDNDRTTYSTLDTLAKDLTKVNSSARALQFPLPIASTAEQLYILASFQEYGKEDDSRLIKLFLPQTPYAVEKLGTSTCLEDLKPVTNDFKISKIGMIGLGAMGEGMAASLLRAGYLVHGYDVFPQAVNNFLSHPGRADAARSPADAAEGSEVVIIMVQNASQVDDVLFGAGRVAETLSNGAVVILSSTVPPHYVQSLQDKLKQLDKGVFLLDAPVSGGVVRAANGNLTIICSGPRLAVTNIHEVLMAMTGLTTNLHYVHGGVGAASSIKCVNQLLAGVHIVAAAEAMAFASRLGLDLKSLYEVLSNSTSWSWMFANRVPQILNMDWTPHSALAIFVKDLGIVLNEAKRLQCFCPISSAAHNIYLSAASHGISHEADVGVVRLWTLLTGFPPSDRPGP